MALRKRFIMEYEPSQKTARKRKVVQVAIDAVASNGGVFTAICRFSDAIESWADTFVVNFVSKETVSSSSGWAEIHISHGFLGRRYGFTSKAECTRAENILSGADLVIIHVPFRYHADFAAKWCDDNDVPYLFVPHGAFDPYAFSYRAWMKRLWLFAKGNSIVRRAVNVVFATAAEEAKARRMVPITNSVVVPWPVDVSEQNNSQRLRARFRVRERYGMESDSCILLYLGRLHQMKRPIETASAFSAVDIKGWYLIFAGAEDGVSRRDLLKNSFIKAVGPVYSDEKKDLILGADALILYSWRENFSFAVAEALSNAIPVLVSDELDLAEVIRREDCGWTVDARLEQGRIEGIRTLVAASAEVRQNRGARGRAWVARDLSKSFFDNRLKEIMTGAIERTCTVGQSHYPSE